MYMKSCQYFAAHIPEESTGNRAEDDADFTKKNLPIEYLLDEHRDDTKRDKQN